MFFKKKDKESNPLRDGVTYQPASNKKSPQFKNSDSSKDSDPTDKMKKPLVDTSFVFFEDK